VDRLELGDFELYVDAIEAIRRDAADDGGFE
jgi:hypothetical protein